MIVPKYFEDFDHLHVNTMPNRAYYIPASRRMEDLGFLPGQQVTALHTPPFGGITAYQVLDTVIALRDTDASRITLYTLQDEKDDVL